MTPLDRKEEAANEATASALQAEAAAFEASARAQYASIVAAEIDEGKARENASYALREAQKARELSADQRGGAPSAHNFIGQAQDHGQLLRGHALGTWERAAQMRNVNAPAAGQEATASWEGEAKSKAREYVADLWEAEARAWMGAAIAHEAAASAWAEVAEKAALGGG